MKSTMNSRIGIAIGSALLAVWGASCATGKGTGKPDEGEARQQRAGNERQPEKKSGGSAKTEAAMSESPPPEGPHDRRARLAFHR